MKKFVALLLLLSLFTAAISACANIEYDDESSSSSDTSSGVIGVSSEAPSVDSSIFDVSVDDSTSVADSSVFSEHPDNGAGLSFSNGLLILGNRCMESFAGTYDGANYYSQVVKQYKKDLGDNVNVYSLVAPTSSSIYLKNVIRDGVDFYEKYGGNQADKLAYLDEKFENSGVVSVNVYDALYKHWDEQIYFRTDWHWTQLGAYYAAEEFAKVAGLEIKSINDDTYYEKTGKYNEDGTPKAFIGTFYASAGSPAVLKNNPDEFFWYDFKHDYTVDYYDRETGKTLKSTRDTCYLHINDSYTSAWYMTFLDADNNLCKINTGTKNGKTIVLFKDSFGNCFAPLLMSMYETIYVVDCRYFTANSITFCKDVGATDVMFVISSFSAMGQNAQKIESMRSK